MTKRIQKGKKGEASQYITRKQALKKLQLSLRDFRRLCILKGIYPREPKKKFKGFKKMYYHVKDIKFLAHERLLAKFREIAAFSKKITRAKIRHEPSEVERLTKNKPQYTLDHLVKERYANFQDALRDLDDPLCLIALYSNFASHKTLKIDLKTVQECRRLWKEFELYVILTQSLKKAFFSIKGVYYQAQIHGEKITWLVPYKFTQQLPYEIDYDVMGSFVQFYMTLLRLVNLRLYKEIAIDYPVISKSQLRENPESLGRPGEDVMALQKKTLKKIRQEYLQQEDEEEQEQIKEMRRKFQAQLKQKQLFKGLKFYLNREVPRQCLEFLIRSYGGEVGHQGDDSAFTEEDDKITHQIVDRNMSQKQKINSSRELVQPQWVIDSINNKMLLPVYQYAPGKTLPAHLSPFVDNEAEGYIPTRQKELNELKGVSMRVDEQEEDFSEEQEEEEQESQVEDDEESEEEEEEEEQGQEQVKEARREEESDSEEDELLLKAAQAQSKRAKGVETKELGKLMMSNRTKKLYRNIQSAKHEKRKVARQLEEKRAKLKS